MKYLMKPGRAANASQLGAGTLIHAVDTEETWGSFQPALCGTRPGKRTPGWGSDEYDAPTCPRCLKKLAKVTP